MRPTTETILEALYFVEATGNNYAKAYATECTSMFARGATREELQTQIMYILSNYQHCRAAGAKDVRQILKDELEA